MAVPLVHRDRVIGVVDLETPKLGYFTDEHVRVFSTLAPQIAIAIENARLYERVVRSEARLERDLERAREIQVHMMPGLSPSVPGLDVAVRFQPARELGGDLYDFFAYGRDRHVIVVGDVSGKGAPAALYGAMVSGILRSLAPQRLAGRDMLNKLNMSLLERKIDGHFVTLLYCIWEPKSRTLQLGNAGMPLPILVRGGHSRSIRAEGVPLGLLEHTEYDEASLTLEKGDVLAIFSDGIVEAMNPQNEEFGTRRLENVLRQEAQATVPRTVERIFVDVSRHEQGGLRRDDQTLVLMRAR
jgi:sigma-B regulation protein RsbU (phosphoserine phosphatase)